MPRTRRQIAALKNLNYQVLPPKNDISLFQKRGDCIEGLPLSIFLLLRSYLSPLDYRELMNCNLATFQPIKYETVEYNIIGPERWDPIDSVHDDNKKEFVKKTLINSVKDKSSQISITMNGIALPLLASSNDLIEGIHRVSVTLTWSMTNNVTETLDYHMFDNIHHVRISSGSLPNIAGGFENVVRLELSNLSRLESITNINHNKTLRYLSITHCYSLKKLDIIFEDIKVIHIECQNLISLEGLRGDIENITFKSSKEINLSTANELAFIAPKLKYLDVSCKWPIEFQDFQVFQNIPSLHLFGRQSSSFSPIFEGTNLHLDSFNLTVWKSSNHRLESLHTLKLENCIGLVDLPVIPSLTRLTMYQMTNLQTIPPLMNLRELEIRFCRDLVSIASIQPSLRKLSIERAPALKSVRFENIQLLESVTLSECPLITDLASLRTIPKLSIIRCDGISSLEALGGSSLEEDRRTIELSYLKNVRNFSGLHHIHSLKISWIPIEHLDGIHDINHLHFYSCSKFETTEGLKNIHCSLTLQYCPHLTNLVNVEGIPLIKLISCSSLKSLEGLKNIEEVHFSGNQISPALLKSKQRELNIQKLVITSSSDRKERVYTLN